MKIHHHDSLHSRITQTPYILLQTLLQVLIIVTGCNVWELKVRRAKPGVTWVVLLLLSIIIIIFFSLKQAVHVAQMSYTRPLWFGKCTLCNWKKVDNHPCDPTLFCETSPDCSFTALVAIFNNLVYTLIDFLFTVLCNLGRINHKIWYISKFNLT